MKPSTAIRKARQHHSLNPFGGQWHVINRPEGEIYTTSTGSTNYVQARQWYKENVAATALQILGWDEEDACMVGFYNTGTGTAQELVEICIGVRLNNNWWPS